MPSTRPRDTDKTIAFGQGGYYFLKSADMSLCIRTTTDTGSERRGHVHLDMGSFTFSYRGVPVVVDPGTFTYTRNRKERDRFRSVFYHNVALPADADLDRVLSEGYFGLSLKDKLVLERTTASSVRLHHDYFSNRMTREIAIDGDALVVTDQSDGPFESLLHLHPDVACDVACDAGCDPAPGNRFLLKAPGHVLHGSSDSEAALEGYFYSDGYGKRSEGQRIRLRGEGQVGFRLSE